MGDEPEVPGGGTNQPTGQIATDFRLNEAAMAQLGPERAAQFEAVLHSTAADCGDADLQAVATMLRERFDRIGVAVDDVEIDRFAEQIQRSARVVRPGEGNPFDVD